MSCLKIIQKIILFACFFMSLSVGAQMKFDTDQFLYGASVYPEIQTKEEQIKMLDLFADAGFTVLRLGESAWGNLEPEPGKFDFEWLRFFLDEMHKRNIKAILGTCSYVPPLWLTARHPEVLIRFEDGSSPNPMGRHAISRNHPLFRKELQKFLTAYGKEFKDHPAVIGWQLDNEIEQNLGRVDFNATNNQAWVQWLKKRFHTVDDLNDKLGLKAWGLKVLSFEDVPKPSKSNDGGLPALRLAALHFDRDNIIEYLGWQKAILQDAGVKHWITTNWMTIVNTLADVTELENILDVSSINQYQPTHDDPSYWASHAMFNDMHRSASLSGNFLVTETRIGPTGGEKLWTPASSKVQFFTWMLQPVAFGAVSIIHWTGNRFNGGHWPHWGGLLDWSGTPEPDFYWSKEIATFLNKWSDKIVNTTVDVKAAVFNDFDQRSCLTSYPHLPSSSPNDILYKTTEAFHRNGIGVDIISSAEIAKGIPAKYKTLVIAASPCFEGVKLNASLEKYVANGGTLIVTPFCGYQTIDGIFRNNGFSSDICNLTGTIARTVRLLAEPKGGKKNRVYWQNEAFPLDSFNVEMEGLTETLEVDPSAKVIARFSSPDLVVNEKPAVTIKTIGKGQVMKLAFWPSNNQITNLIKLVTANEMEYVKDFLPEGVQAVPRTDGSIFIINTMSTKAKVSLNSSMKDRITGTQRDPELVLNPYESLWLEK